MKLEHLSASRLKVYDQCPKKYWAIYHANLPQESHAAANLGQAIHKAFEVAVRARRLGKHRGLWDPMAVFNMACRKCKVVGANEQEVAGMVQAATRWGYFSDLSKVTGCEVEFNLTLPDGTPVNGYLDRLDVDGHSAQIFDLKTGKWRLSQSDMNASWQTQVYNWAVRKAYPQVSGRVAVAYWQLRYGVYQAWCTAADADRAEARMLEMAKEIRENLTPETRPSSLCPWCPLKNECPAALLQRR